MEKTYYIGLDVGSTTAKIAVIDSDNRVIYSKYERHNARVNELVSQYFDEILALTGDAEARICVTGSVGMATAEQLQAEFVQEVVAASVYARTAHPEAKALIDIGGEDAEGYLLQGKRKYGTAHERQLCRRNGRFHRPDECADGRREPEDERVGDEGRARLSDGCPLRRIRQDRHPEPDGAQSAEADIAASIFHSIAVQTVVTLSHGISFEAPILLCGGPLDLSSGAPQGFLRLSPSLSKRLHRIRKQQSHSGSGLCLPG